MQQLYKDMDAWSDVADHTKKELQGVRAEMDQAKSKLEV